MQEESDGGGEDYGEVTLIAGSNTAGPGRWVVSRVDGFAWFEPAMFDPELYDLVPPELKQKEMED